MSGDDDLIAGFELADHRQATVSFCNCDQLGDALLGERHELIELLLAEGLLLGGALHLDDAAGPGHHEIGVGLGASKSSA